MHLTIYMQGLLNGDAQTQELHVRNHVQAYVFNEDPAEFSTQADE